MNILEKYRFSSLLGGILNEQDTTQSEKLDRNIIYGYLVHMLVDSIAERMDYMDISCEAV